MRGRQRGERPEPRQGWHGEAASSCLSKDARKRQYHIIIFSFSLSHSMRMFVFIHWPFWVCISLLMARISRKIACKVPLQLHIQQGGSGTAGGTTSAGESVVYWLGIVLSNIYTHRSNFLSWMSLRTKSVHMWVFHCLMWTNLLTHLGDCLTHKYISTIFHPKQQKACLKHRTLSPLYTIIINYLGE